MAACECGFLASDAYFEPTVQILPHFSITVSPSDIVPNAVEPIMLTTHIKCLIEKRACHGDRIRRNVGKSDLRVEHFFSDIARTQTCNVLARPDDLGFQNSL